MTNKRKTSLALRFIYIVALIFLCVGLGFLGSFRATGAAFELKTQGSGDAEAPSVLFRMSNPTQTDGEGGETTVYLRLRHVYVNVGAAYTGRGEEVTLRAEVIPSASSVASASSGRRLELNFSTLGTAAQEDGEEETAGLRSDVFYNWIEVGSPASGWTVTAYPYVRLTARTCNLLINEVVFVGERIESNSSSAEGTGEFYVIPAAVYSATPLVGEDGEEAAERAQALLDSQTIPSEDVSRFNRLSQQEAVSMMTVSEMRAGANYGEDNVYEGERVYGSLGTDLLALGTLIFGMSPFGLRFFPMLAAAGALLVGSLFVRRLTGSDRAGLVFSVLFALAGATFALGGLGTPLMIGVFFFLLSLERCHFFYARGMQGKGVRAALPLIVSGLSGAFAILTHGAFLLPVAGVAGLFAAGMVRLVRARRYHLDRAISEAEAEPASAEGGISPARQKAALVSREYANKISVAAVSFGCALVIGAIVFALLFALPLYYPYVKLYSDPAAPTVGIFGLAARAFAGGFTGVNAAQQLSGAWNIFYILSRAQGAGTAAVWGAFLNPACILAAALGLAYFVYNIVRIVRLLRAGERGKRLRVMLRRAAIPFAGLVLALVTAAFASDALLFVLLGWLFALVFAADAVREGTAHERAGRACRILTWVGFGVLAALFLLMFVYTAGLPTALMLFMG